MVMPPSGCVSYDCRLTPKKKIFDGGSNIRKSRLEANHAFNDQGIHRECQRTTVSVNEVEGGEERLIREEMA